MSELVRNVQQALELAASDPTAAVAYGFEQLGGFVVLEGARRLLDT